MLKPRLAARLVTLGILAILPLVSVCTDGITPVHFGGSLQLALAPSLAEGLSADGSLPINQIRVTAYLDPSGDVLSTSTQDVDPNLDSWTLLVEVPIPEDQADPRFYVILELINVTAGVESVEWSGRSQAQSLDLVQVPEIRGVAVVRGPTANLQVTDIVIADHSDRVEEGESVDLEAVVSTTTPDQTPVVFWTTLDAELATVSSDGIVATHSPGEARIVATAGRVADTAAIVVSARPAAVRITPDSVHLQSIEEVVELAASVMDARGADMPEEAVTWEVENPEIAVHLGDGRLQAVAPGRTLVTARSARVPELVDTATVVVAQLPVDIEIQPYEAYLADVGGTVDLVASGQDANGHTVPTTVFSWTSLDADVVSVGASGTVTAVARGVGRVAATGGDAADTVLITVGRGLTSVVITPSDNRLETVGAAVQLAAVALDDTEATIESITRFTWESVDTSVARVDSTGLVTAVANGVTVVTASVGGALDSATVTVGLPVSRVALLPEARTFTFLGETEQFAAAAYDAENAVIAHVQNFVWSSSDPEVILVSEDGLVSAVADGTATVTAEAEGVSGTATVIVAQAVTRIEVSPATHSFTTQGVTQGFTAVAFDSLGSEIPAATQFAWASSNTSVATVDTAGVVTAIGDGTAVVSASAGGVQGTATVTVALQVDTVVVTPASHAFTSEGDTLRLKAEAFDAGGTVIAPLTDFTWTSASPAVVEVDQSGLATAVANGATTVTASVGGVVGTATLTVSQAVASVTISPAPPAPLVFFGQETALDAVTFDAFGSPVVAAVSWTSLDVSVAKVDTKGIVKAVANGTAQIVAASAGVSDTVTVTVAQGVSYITISPRDWTSTAVAQTQGFSAVAYDAGGTVVSSVTAFTWSASDPGVATVGGGITPSTTATSVGDGSAVVTASAGGVQGTASVKVNSTSASLTVTPAAPPTLTRIGGSHTLSATVRDIEGNVLPSAVSWISLDAGVATVGPSSGIVTASGNGTTAVVATSGTVADTVTVKVAQAVSYVTVTPPSKGFTSSGQTQPLTAEAYDAGGIAVSPTATFTWSSSDDGVATVTSGGVVTAVAEGAATITATETVSGETGTASITVGLSVASVVVTPGTKTFTSKGDEQTFTAVAKDAAGKDIPSITSFTWTTSASAVAAVGSSSGLVKAGANGAATITASVGGVSGTSSVIVGQVAATVEVTPLTRTFTSRGETETFTAVAKDANGNEITSPAPTFTWGTSDGAVADVGGSTGVVTSGDNGTATITATAGTASGTSSVTVDQVVDYVEVDPTSTGFSTSGLSQPFTAVAYDAGGTAMSPAGSFTWGTSDGAVADVDALTGVVTSGLTNGTATITATESGSGVPGTASVTVGLDVATVEVTPSTQTFASKGDQLTFTAVAKDAGGTPIGSITSFTWTTSASGVAAVGTSSGEVTAGDNGTATITASVGGVSGTSAVTVGQVVASVEVSPSTQTFTSKGDVQTFTAVAKDANGNVISSPAPTFTWGTSDGAVAGVGVSTGVVTAGDNGTATITATASGVPGTSTVTVSQAVASVEVTPGTKTFTSKDDQQTFTAVAKDGQGNVISPAPVFAWTSSLGTVAAVGASSGLVTAGDNGTATITATASGVSGTSSVAVSQAVATVTVAPSTKTFTARGQQQTFTAEARDAQGNLISSPAPNFAWTSSMSTVADVGTSSGVVTAGDDGSATITATADGVSATSSVTVGQAVASIVVTPTSVATAATSTPIQLTATANDAGGAPVSGVTFVWTSNDPGVVTVDSNGLVTPVADGTTTVDATASGLTGSSAVTITSDALTRAFTGDASGDLLDPANWEPSGVPGPTDALVISAGTTPTLTGDFSIGTLTVQPGATLDIGDFDLTVSGDLTSGGTISGTGTVQMSGTGSAIAGTVPNLLVTGTVTATGDLTVNGDFTIDGNASTFDVGSDAVAISGDLETDNGAILTMSDPNAMLDIDGDLLLGGGDTNGTLSDGTLYLSGELVTVSNSFKTFNPDGNHTVVLNGTTQQSVYLQFPGQAQHRFQNLVIDNAAGVIFKTSVPVVGNATILQGTLRSIADSITTVQSFGDIVDAVGGWQIDRTVVSAPAPALPALLTTALVFDAATSLQNGFTVTGSLTVSGRDANLDLNGQDVTVTGDFAVENYGLLTMTSSAGDLTVQGNSTFEGGNTNGLITAGRIWAGGDFNWAGNKTYSFAPSGTHQVIFNGTAAQQINTPGKGTNLFQNLRIGTTADVTMAEDITVNGDMLLEGTFRIPSATTLTIGGTLTNTGTLVNNGTLNGG